MDRMILNETPRLVIYKILRANWTVRQTQARQYNESVASHPV